MPVYIYRGRSRDNRTITGERFAVSKEALAMALRREQIVAISIREKGKELELPLLKRKKVKDKEIAIFARQLAVMIEAGLPIVQCLDIIAEQKENKAFKTVLQQVRSDVEGGASLADAMQKHPKVFDQLFTSMVAAGESSGALDVILQRLSAYLDKVVKLKRALKSASIYPAAVLTVAFLVVLLLMWKAVPVFKGLFEGLGAQLPLPTRIVIGISDFVADYILFIFAGLALAAFGFRAYYGSEPGRKMIDALVLKIPILGEVFKKIATARFARTLATLLTSGIAITEGLEITARAAGNSVIRNAILRTRRSIEEGKTLSDPLAASGVFSPMVVQMIGVGEQTGELDAMLTKIADYFEEEVDATMANLMTILEPVIIVFLGVVVGGIVISMYLPLFSLVAKLASGAV